MTSIGKLRAGGALALALAAAAFAPHAAPAATVATISTAAGTGVAGFSGDGGPATGARLDTPAGVAAMSDGGFLVADTANHRVRRVAPDGTISTAAGDGTAGSAGDGGAAVAAQLDAPISVAAMPDGGFLIADARACRIRRVAPDGTISTVAGTGVAGFDGDGGPATAALLNTPTGVAADAGGFLIADAGNARIRRVAPGGAIATVAGTGVSGFAGDGGPAVAAQLAAPVAVASIADGGFLIADRDNERVRRVGTGGTIDTAAGSGSAGFSGDGGPATAARLDHPTSTAATADGGFLIADTNSARVRRVRPDGTIDTAAGSGSPGFSGDGGPATSARLDAPLDVAVAPGGFLIADPAAARVRFVGGAGQNPPGAGADTTKPVLGALRVGGGATTIGFDVSEDARITFRVERPGRGRRVGGACVRETRRNIGRRPCTHYAPLPGRFHSQAAAGSNSVSFSGRVGGARLRPGRYRLSARPADSAGNVGSTRRAGFGIARRR